MAEISPDFRLLVQLALLQNSANGQTQSGAQMGRSQKLRKLENGKWKMEKVGGKAPEWLLVGENQIVRNPWRRERESESDEDRGRVWEAAKEMREGGGERGEGGLLTRIGSADSSFLQRSHSAAQSSVDNTEAMWLSPPTSLSPSSSAPPPSFISPSFPAEEPWFPTDLPPLVAAMDPSSISPISLSLSSREIGEEASTKFPFYTAGNFSEGDESLKRETGDVMEGTEEGDSCREREVEGEGEREVSLDDALFDWEKILPLDFCEEETNFQEKNTENGEAGEFSNAQNLESDWLQFENFDSLEDTKFSVDCKWDVSNTSPSPVVHADVSGAANDSKFSADSGIRVTSHNTLPSLPPCSSLSHPLLPATPLSTSLSSAPLSSPPRSSLTPPPSSQDRNCTSSVSGSFQDVMTADSNFLSELRALLDLEKSQLSDHPHSTSALHVLTGPQENSSKSKSVSHNGDFPGASGRRGENVSKVHEVHEVHGVRTANQIAETFLAAAAKDEAHRRALSSQFLDGRKRKEREGEWESSPSLFPPPPYSSFPSCSSFGVPYVPTRSSSLPHVRRERGVREENFQRELVRNRVINQQSNSNIYGKIVETRVENRGKWTASGANAHLHPHGKSNLYTNMNILNQTMSKVAPRGTSLEAQLADLQNEWRGKRTVRCLDLESLNMDLWIPRR